VAEPGDFLALDVAGEQVIVVRNRSGEISAHYDVCRHRGSRLTTPDQRADPATVDPAFLADADDADDPSGNLVRQPGAPGPSGRFKASSAARTTSWCYELDGASATPVPRRVRCVRARGVRPVPRGGGPGRLAVRQPVASSGSRRATPAAQLGEIPHASRATRWPTCGRAPDVYDVRANWKVIVENYNECYHCSGVHPSRPHRAGVPREGWRQPGLTPAPQAEGTFTFTLRAGRTASRSRAST
jgi:Rieske 2Fe-2S family protein